MARCLPLLLLAGMLVMPAAPVLAAPHAHEAAPQARPAGLNPVQHEMRELTAAMDVILRAVANRELATVAPALARVHAARQQTAAALGHGAYRPPQHGQDLAGFERQDEAFHEELVGLLEAARANDLPRATRQVGVLVQGCTTCHVRYRFRP